MLKPCLMFTSKPAREEAQCTQSHCACIDKETAASQPGALTPVQAAVREHWIKLLSKLLMHA